MLNQLDQQWQASAVGRWYYGREASERKVIALLAAAIAITLVWLLIWQPVSNWRSLSHNRYENAQASLDWLTQNEQKARAAVTSQSAGSDRSLLRLVTQAANAGGLKLNRVQPEGDGAVSVVLQDQAFNDVLAFVAQLAENNGVSVNRAAIDGSGNPGRVNAQIKFQ